MKLLAQINMAASFEAQPAALGEPPLELHVGQDCLLIFGWRPCEFTGQSRHFLLGLAPDQLDHLVLELSHG